MSSMSAASDPGPILRRTWAAADLMAAHPPRVMNANKRLILDVACPPDGVHRGRIGVTRWRAMDLPPAVPAAPGGHLVPAPGYFDYRPVLDSSEAVEWHVNFADPRLFVAYAGSLFAQDEMQVAEHPALAAVREALLTDGVEPLTVDGGGPTPILVTGVERRVAVATDPDPAAGRKAGLYGNAFSAADDDVVRRATTRLDPPTVTNLIAMAAIPGGRGRYRRDEIETTLITAYTGFRAAVLESRGLRGSANGFPSWIVVHTGFWGCGAFGGDRVLMALLQLVAARLAGLHRLVFHTGPPGGDAPLREAAALLADLPGDEPSAIDTLIDALDARGFRWGVSDGN
jgi:hypothetical protein